jgi:8-oxo-dGTP diphosphatase
MPELKRRSPVIGAGVVAWRGDEVLLVRRGQAPRLGEWSLPGGRQQWGETIRDCALRELKEETGLSGEILGLLEVVDAVFPGAEGEAEQRFTLIDFAVRVTGGELKAGDDAAEARWHADASLESLGLWSETLRVIRAARRFWP